MQDYDTVLKLLLRSSATNLLLQVTNTSIHRWMDVELPSVQQLRVDLLGETRTGGLEHIELQSRNDARMPFRMLEYRLAIYRRYNQFPRQTVLYAGKEALRMPTALQTDNLVAQYNLLDASELDGEALLASGEISDNVLAILARVPNQREAIRSLIAKTARLDRRRREDTMSQISIVSGLRGLEDLVREESKRMPITENILDHKLIGPAYRLGMEKGMEQGIERGIEKGIEQGMEKGERAVLRKQLEKRFGPLPPAVKSRLEQSSTEALEDLGVRLLDASSLEELLG